MATAAPPAGPAAKTAGGGGAAAKTAANTPARKQIRGRLISNLRKVKNSPKTPMQFLICVGSTKCIAHIGPAVTASHRVAVRNLMGKDQGLRFHRGRCVFENGCWTFVGLTVNGTLKPKLEKGLIELTGTKWRVRLRSGVIDEPDEPGAAAPAAAKTTAAKTAPGGRP